MNNQEKEYYLPKHDLSDHESHPWFENKIYPQLLYKHNREDHDLISVSDETMGCIMHYLYFDGRYNKLSDNACKLFIKNHLPEQYRHPKHWEQVMKELNTDAPDISMNELDGDEAIINFKNGLYNISTRELMPHSPDIYSSVQLPCNNDTSLTLRDAPIFSRFLNDITSGDDDLKILIMQYIGAIVSNVNGYRFKRLLILFGMGNTGETQIRGLVEKILGKEHCHSESLQVLNARFGTSQIYGKRMVGSGELSAVRLDEMNIIKELTGGDDMNGEQKGKDGFSFKFRGLLWFNCNQLPKFKGDRGPHVYERFLIVPCTNVIPKEKQDANILEKMYEERDAIVNVAVKLLQRAIFAGYKFTEGVAVKRARREYEYQNNSLCEFIKSECDLTLGSTKRSEFNKAYFQWCRDNSLPAEQLKDIGDILRDVYGITPKKSGEVCYDLSIKSYQLNYLSSLR